MDKLNEVIDFYEMTGDEPELLVMLLELRRHRQDNWKQRAETAESQFAELAKQDRYTPTIKWEHPGYPIAVMEKSDTGKFYSRPAPAAVPVDVVPDYFDRLVSAAKERAEKAMRKFPQPNYVLNKVAEESGEVIKAVIHYTEGREDWLSVEGELIDNLAMLFRLVTEGDGVIGFSPPEEVLRRIEGRQC